MRCSIGRGEDEQDDSRSHGDLASAMTRKQAVWRCPEQEKIAIRIVGKSDGTSDDAKIATYRST